VVRDDAKTIARRFLDARRSAAGLEEYPGELPETLDEAYAIQDRAIAEWNKPILGWKVGRIHSPLSERYGADRLAGPIFSVVEAPDTLPEMPIFPRGFAAAEAEFLLRIGAAPPAGKSEFTLAETAALIDAVHIGIEIASSPLKPINDIGPAAIISDFGNNNGLVVGSPICDWRTSGFEDWEVTTWIGSAQVGCGEARSFPNGPIGAATFLFELLAKRGIEVKPGQWISSGAITGVHDLKAGQTVEARFDHSYRVRCRAVAGELG